ncbi:MAG: GYD domain-containing protein [Planctomycetota bacterium]
METFVLMTKLSPELLGDPRGRKAAGKAWLRKVASLCPDVKWVAHYALLGRYDFMDIYEAPDAVTAHRVSYISRSEGAVEAESWHAVPYDSYLDLIGDVDA